MIVALALLAALSLGVSGFFAGRAAKSCQPMSLMVWGPFISLPFLLLPLLFGVDFTPQWGMIIFASLSGVVLFAAWLFYLLALRAEDTSPVVAVSSIYPLFSLLLLLLLGQEVAGVWLFAGVFFMSLGLLLLQAFSSSFSAISKRSLLLGLATALCWGLWGFLDYQALQYGSVFDLMFYSLLFSLLTSTALLFWRLARGDSLQISRQTIHYRFYTAFASAIAMFAFYYALSVGDSPAAIIAMTAAYPLVTMLLAISVKQEGFYPSRALATLLIALGVILMQL